MDALSDVLRVVRLTGAVFFTARLSSPWSFRSPPASELAPVLGVRPDCLALFHILVQGRCWLTLDAEAPVEVEAGTIFVLPHGHAHVVSSRLDLSPHPLATLLAQCGGDAGHSVPRVSHGRGGEITHFVCGYFHCDQRFNPLIGVLPSLLVACPGRGRFRTYPVEDTSSAGITGEEDESAGSNAPLEAMLRHMLQEVEQERPGGPAMVARLAELLYLEVLRQYMRRLPEGQTGWLAGVQHPEVGRALRLLHANPGEDWTVEELARRVHLSRSTLAQRFTEVLGESPMRYLAGWRMQLAKHLLRQPELSIAQVAALVGYHSDVAFHRAFKRNFGEPPASWRMDAV